MNLRNVHVKRHLLSPLLFLLALSSCGEKELQSSRVLPPSELAASLGQHSEDDGGDNSHMDSEELLRGLLEEERQARIDADKQLSDRIDAIELQLSGFAEEVKAEIERLDQQDMALEEKLIASEASLFEKLDQLATDTDTNLKEAVTQLRDSLAADFEGELAELNEAYQANLSRLEADLVAMIDTNRADAKAEFQKVYEKLKNLESTHNADMKKLRKELVRLEAELSQADAKERLERQQDYESLLKSIEILAQVQDQERKTLEDTLMEHIDMSNKENGEKLLTSS